MLNEACADSSISSRRSFWKELDCATHTLSELSSNYPRRIPVDSCRAISRSWDCRVESVFGILTIGASDISEIQVDYWIKLSKNG
jgi:hypothetical protein